MTRHLPILVADADPTFLATLNYALEAHSPGAELRLATTYEEALARATENPAPFLALVDLSLPRETPVSQKQAPGPSGTHLLVQLRDQHEGIVPVLMSQQSQAELRGAILSAYLRVNLFAFAEKRWLFDVLGQLIDTAQMRYAGQPVRLRPDKARQARLWLDPTLTRPDFT